LITVKTAVAVLVGAGLAFVFWVVVPKWDLPTWVPVVGVALVAGWVGARVLYPWTNLLFGRVVGTIFAVLTFLMLSFGIHSVSQAVVIGLCFLVLGSGLVGFRISQSHHFDAVPGDDALLPILSDDGEELVDVLDGLWGSTRRNGPRNGLRAVHAHGSLVRGRFERTGKVPECLAVALFRTQGGLEVLGRFSNFNGAIRRDDRPRQTHGLALKFGSTEHAPMDIVTVDIRRFIAANPEDFAAVTRQFTRRGLRRWLGLAALAAAGRTSLVALVRSAVKRPASYAEREYHGLNTFLWGRHQTPVRFRLTPLRHPGEDAPPVRLDAYMLDTELQDRLKGQGNVTFSLDVVVGKGLPKPRLLDPLHPWPRCAPVHPIGTVILNEYVPLDEHTEEDHDPFLFEPFRLTAGVEPSADEILLARRAAYPASYLRRCPLELLRP
jgi:catalase